MSALQAIFNRRIRGFRVVHVAAFACLSLLVLSVYLTKAAAGREAAAIATIQEIGIEGQLEAAVADRVEQRAVRTNHRRR